MSLGVERLANDIERMHLRNQFSAVIARTNAELEDVMLTNSANLAEKWALRAALSKIDPGHPLLSEEVKNKLHAEAEKTFSSARNWDRVAEAGRNFQYDYTPKKSQRESQLEAEVATLRKSLAELEAVNIQNHVEKHALRVALTRIDSSHPMVWPKANESELIAALRKAGLTAYMSAAAANPVTAYEAVTKVAEEFEYPLDYTRPRKNILESYQGETEAIRARLTYLTDEQNFRIV